MKLNAFGIICSDIEASLGFYQMLGSRFPTSIPVTATTKQRWEGGYG